MDNVLAQRRAVTYYGSIKAGGRKLIGDVVSCSVFGRNLFRSQGAAFVDRGKWVIVSMVGFGLLMAVLGWLYNRGHSRLVIQHWGWSTAQLVRHGSSVELLVLGNATDKAVSQAPATLPIRSVRQPIVTRHDISTLPGLMHARHALIQDATYTWRRPLPACRGDWDFALRFSDQDQSQTLVVHLDCQRVRRLEADDELELVPHIADEFRQFLARFDTASPAPAR